MANPGRRTDPNMGLAAMFTAAFTQSRNPMVLVDDQRRHVDTNGAS